MIGMGECLSVRDIFIKINAVTLEKLENKGYLKDKPVALQLDADDNPMVIVYTFKN